MHIHPSFAVEELLKNKKIIVLMESHCVIPSRSKVWSASVRLHVGVLFPDGKQHDTVLGNGLVGILVVTQAFFSGSCF